MNFQTFQEEARRTDQVPGSDGDAIVVPLLGIAGETASLLSQYKKRIRDGDAHQLFREHVAEELGDLLWYVANLASKFELDLDAIAAANLAKTQRRWLPAGELPALSTGPLLFDEPFPASERFPRRIRAEISSAVDKRGRATAALLVDGTVVGDTLRDNAYLDDGYRFHDVFHLGNIAMLGWSPTMRGLMGRKRRSNPMVDEVEDGGRAQVIDEGIAAFVFDYARRTNFLEGVTRIDYEVLRTIANLTRGLEVSVRSPYEWERAILTNMAVWRTIRANKGGRLRLDLLKRELVVTR
jgi:NTP pyrophosphatase (non-canonical NTP hydrolase)